MEKDPQHRASVSELRDHPWVRRHRGRDADLSKFVARHSNVDEKINDTAWLMVNRLHMFLDMGVKGVDKAAALFTEGADIRINGDAGAGPGNAAARLRQVRGEMGIRGVAGEVGWLRRSGGMLGWCKWDDAHPSPLLQSWTSARVPM